jgi:hypothetical protein
MHPHPTQIGPRGPQRSLPGIVAMACCLGLGAPQAHASESIVSDNTSLSSAGTNDVSGDTWLAASLTLDSLEGESLLATLVGGTTNGSASLQLYSSDASSLIPGTALASFTADATSTDTLSFSLAGLTLSAGTYWLVLSNTEGASSWSWTTEETGSGGGFTGAWANSDDAGTTWFSNSTLYPLQMSVSVSSVPEPSAWLMGLSGLMGLTGVASLAASRRRATPSIHTH